MKIKDSDLYKDGEKVDDTDSIFANVPEILKNYKAYLNG
jgi:hypothetical protein